MPDPSATRPELIDLQNVERERVSELVAVKGGHCAGCGAKDFTVGHALYLGFCSSTRTTTPSWWR